MVFKKRISCIILSVVFIFAVCAPCALGVFADDISTSTSVSSYDYRSETLPSEPSRSVSTRSEPVYEASESLNNISRAEQYERFGWSVDPAYFFYDADTIFAVNRDRTYKKKYDGPCIAALRDPRISGSTSSYYTVCCYCPTIQQNAPAFVEYTSSAINSPTLTTLEGYGSFYCVVGGGYTSTPSVINVPLTVAKGNSLEAVLSECGFSTDPVTPDPSSDGWTYGTTDLYFTNISDSNFAFNQTNYPFSSFPSKDIIVDDSPSKIIVGAFWDNTSWLSSGTTISGQLQVQFTSPLTSVDNFIQRGFIWFVNGSDPSLSGFQYFEVPTSWEYMFSVWKYGVNQWTNEYIFNFEFTLPDDLQTAIGFTPSNILIGLYGILPSGSFSTECWYNVQNLVFGYYIPPSSGEPDVPSTPVFNNPDNTSTVINPSQPTVTDNLNTELGFYDNVWKSYNLTSDTFIDFFEEVIGFGATNLDDALGRLYQAFSYTGSGSIKLPSATIPWGDTTLQLWEEQDIPLAYWFSNLPSQIKVVFGFIIVFSVASACWGIAFYFIRKIISGNYQTSDF